MDKKQPLVPERLQRRGCCCQYRAHQDRLGVASSDAEAKLTELQHKRTACAEHANGRTSKAAELPEPGGEWSAATDFGDRGFLASGKQG